MRLGTLLIVFGAFTLVLGCGKSSDGEKKADDGQHVEDLKLCSGKYNSLAKANAQLDLGLQECPKKLKKCRECQEKPEACDNKPVAAGKSPEARMFRRLSAENAQSALERCKNGLKELEKYQTRHQNELVDCQDDIAGCKAEIAQAQEDKEEPDADTGAKKPNKVGKQTGKSGPRYAKGTAKEREVMAAFNRVVAQTRGFLAKCYKTALNKGSLPRTSVTIKISVSYHTDGTVRGNPTLSPRISGSFQGCLSAVVKSLWKLPATSKPMTFQTSVVLQPQ